MKQASRHRHIELDTGTHWQVFVIGAAAGALLALIGLRPTGEAPVDAVVMAAACGFVVWCAATAPWWMLLATAAVAAGLVPPGVMTLGGVAAVLAAGWIGLQGRAMPLARAGVAAAVLVGLGEMRDLYRFGVTAAIGITVAVVLAVAGLARRSHHDRSIAVRVVAVTAIFVVMAGGLAAMAAYRSQSALSDGNRQARQGLQQLRNANFAAASTSFAEASTSFGAARSAMSKPWVQPARLVPVVAQYRNAGEALSGSAASASASVAKNVNQIDLDQLKFVDGTIDIGAIRSLEQPLTSTQSAMRSLDNAVAAADSPWLAAPVRDRLVALSADLADQQQLSRNTLEAIQMAPTLLGERTPRRYFLMFTTPAEARGQGGFMGNWAEITADNGKISMTKFGRSGDLNRGVPDGYRLANAPADFISKWGPTGFALGEDGHVSKQAWSIINVSAHFPNTARVIDELYPVSGGRDIDGVFSIDVYGLQALVGLVGPIQVQGGPELNGENTADYLLLGQYLNSANNLDENAQRVDMLEAVATEVVTRLLSTNPPEPLALGKSLAPMVRQRRLVGWSASTDEQSMLEMVGMDGAVLTDREVTVDDVRRPGIQIATNNGVGNKIDTFLRRKIIVDGTSVTATYTNTAPTSGMPEYVIGSASNIDVPIGTDILGLTVYSTAKLSDFAVNGQPVVAADQAEGGRLAYGLSVTIASGESATITFTVAEPDAININQPLALQVDDPS